MTFTYNLASADPDIVNISRVRLEIGDTVSGSGVRPSNANLTDEEIGVWLAQASDNVYVAAAMACNALSRHWSTMTNLSVGSRSENFGDIAQKWLNMGKAIMAQYGGGGVAGSANFIRSDGYSEHAAESTE